MGSTVPGVTDMTRDSGRRHCQMLPIGATVPLMTSYRERGGDPRGIGMIPEGMQATGASIATTGVGDTLPGPAWEIVSIVCPDDGGLLRDVDGGIECPECGHFEPDMQGPLPPPFDGPSLRGS